MYSEFSPPLEEMNFKPEAQFDHYYDRISDLVKRLDTFFYKDGEMLYEEEMDDLADTVNSLLDFDPELVHVLTDKKYFSTWENLCKLLYKGVTRCNSEEILEKISHTLGRIFKIAHPETNKSPADPIVEDLLFRLPWSDHKYRPKRTKLSERNEIVLTKFFDQFGLKAEKVLKVWYASSQRLGPINFQLRNARQNMMEMRRLESKYPNGPKTLIENFGVYCFKRYPEGMLDDQLDQIDDINTPYGIMISSLGDHNGVSYRNVNGVKSLWTEAKKNGMNFRAIEASSKWDMTKKLLFLEKQYNIPGNQKILFGVISGHGNESLIQIGLSQDSRSDISKKDVLSPTFAHGSQRFFEDGAYLILESCLTGAKNGLAEQASKNMNLHIIASPQKTSKTSYKIIPSMTDSKPPEILAKYRSKSNLFIQKRMSRFSNSQNSEVHSD